MAMLSNLLGRLLRRPPPPPLDTGLSKRPAISFDQVDGYGNRPNPEWIGEQVVHLKTNQTYTITGFRWIEKEAGDFWSVEYIENERLINSYCTSSISSPNQRMGVETRGPGYARPIHEFRERPDGKPRFEWIDH